MKKEIILFDNFLSDKGFEFEAIIIGGAALNIMGVITRETRDVDFLDPDIPDEIKKASIEFANTYPELKLEAKEWLNNGPASLKRDLPEGWRSGVQQIFKGRALSLFTLGRLNLLSSMLTLIGILTITTAWHWLQHWPNLKPVKNGFSWGTPVNCGQKELKKFLKSLKRI